ncbi:MAG: ABC transporter ATP-binding protein [Clostridia bacterium]|nr:ABC transporter ATP-binding protein [Clostridia bacterium]
MISMHNVTQVYGTRCVLNIEDMSFEPGRIYALMGPNGSGKTTLLRIMAGILQPTTGELTGFDPASTGYMPQRAYAFGFSVLKNVTMALENADEEAAMEALRAVGMDHMAQANGSGLSGGEAQRLALARMIARPRRLLLLDEPTSATDIAGMGQVEKALVDYVDKTNCVLVFSTHSPAQASRFATDVVMLQDGVAMEMGDAKSVLLHPKTEAARTFLQHWQIRTEE